MNGGLSSHIPIEKYYELKVITVLDGDDWRWVFVGQKLVYQGHDDYGNNADVAVLDELFGADGYIIQNEWIEGDLAEEMSLQEFTLFELQSRFGHEPEDIVITAGME